MMKITGLSHLFKWENLHNWWLTKYFFAPLYVTLEHRCSHKQHRYICSNSQQYIVWVKIIDFYFMPKIILILRSCSMKMFCKCITINISKLYFFINNMHC